MKKIFLILALALSFATTPALAISDTQEKAITDHCEAIKDDLKNVQKLDARTRVYLGGYYETILTKFITPLNVRLVENNMSSTGLIDGQDQFVKKRMVFVNDYIVYQQGLEDLVGTNCKTEPAKFYEKLSEVRAKRKIVSQDVTKIRELISEHVKLVKGLKEKL